MTIHRQTWVKVNAQVDVGIASLIESLSGFPDVRTLDSCEGGKEDSWVCFDCGEQDWRKLAEFVFGRLGPALVSEFGDRVNISVTITESGLYRAEMTVLKSITPAVSETIQQLSKAA